MNRSVFAHIFTCPVLALLFLCSILVPAEADTREWTSKFRARAVSGEFVELKEGRLTLRKPDGSTFAIPISALVDEDQEFARKAQTALDAENEVDVTAALKDRMIHMVDGKPQPFQFPTQSPPSHVLFYVVSSRCDSCTEDAPRVEAYYKEVIAPATQIELILVSLDTTTEEQQEYLAGHRLTFPAIEFKAIPEFEKAITPRIFSKAIDGCQTFILATVDGKVLKKSSIAPKREIAAITESP